MSNNILQIIQFLEDKHLLLNSPKYWWPNAGSFEVVIGAILTQNTTWQNVEKSLKNLENYLTLDLFLTLKLDNLKQLIKPSGFYNQKASRLIQLANNIQNDFDSFENFKNNVTRKWLLDQKGVGEETADAILCYCCFKEELVIDTYTKRLLKIFNIEFKSYSDYKTYLQNGIKTNWKIIKDRYENNLNLCYSQFHGMVVEYNKLIS